MATLTQQQRQALVNYIVHDINDAQVSDYYEIGNLKIEWRSRDEAYRIQVGSKKAWATPRDIEWYINNLDNSVLFKYYVDDTNDEDLEDLEAA
jgi:hypothetical protein